MDIRNNIVATEKFVEDQLLNNQSDWNQSDYSQKNYIKNRPFYDDTVSGGELKKLDTKYLPDEIVTCQTAKVGQLIVVKSVNKNGVPIEWESVDGQNSQDYLILKDETTGYKYALCMNRGSLESHITTANIEIVKLPNKTNYTDTEEFDPTGMIIHANTYDGYTEEITDYEYDKYVTTGTDFHEIRYTKYGITNILHVPITTRNLEVALQDFVYTTNEDGTYTIIEWKETLNGEPSTRMILPNSDLIIV